MYISKLTKLCTLTVCSLLYISYTSKSDYVYIHILKVKVLERNSQKNFTVIPGQWDYKFFFFYVHLYSFLNFLECMHIVSCGNCKKLPQIEWIKYIMRNTGLEEAQAGIRIAGRNISNLRYADDTTLMAESEEELKSLLMKVAKRRVKKLA